MHFLALFITIVGLAFPVEAHDDLFVLPQKSGLEALLAPEAETPEALSDADKAKEYLDIYYRRCIAQDHNTLLAEPLKTLCSCTLGNLKERFRAKSILRMFEKPPRGQIQRDKALKEAYTPCMKYAVQENVKATCLGDRVMKWKLNNHLKVCTCMADSIRADFAAEAERYTDAYLQHYREDYSDPLDWYFKSESYKQQSEKRFKTCVRWYDR